MRIEIVMATYNGGAYLAQQIDSIIQQTFSSWHLTISDDGSTDNTVDIIKEYAERYPEKIKRYQSGTRFGNAKDHFLHLMKNINEDYVMFADQDDVWLPDKLSVFHQKMQDIEEKVGGKAPILLFSDLTPVDENLHVISNSMTSSQDMDVSSIHYKKMIFQNTVTGCASMINRPLLDLANRYSDSSKIIMHDWWLAIVAARFGTVEYVDQPTVLYRQHQKNSVGFKNVKSARYMLNRVFDLGSIKQTIAAKKAQALQFAQTYNEYLNEDDKLFLNQFAKTRSGIAFYMKNRKEIHGLHRFLGIVTLG